MTIEEKFALFWMEYRKKVSKQKAFTAFKKINPSEECLNSILNTLKQQKNTYQWQKDGGQYVPYPATYLNQKRWEDETVGETIGNDINPPENGYGITL